MSNTIHLQAGNSCAEIRPLGAQIVSYTAPDGREVIWQGDPAIWADHTPILFPVIGNVKDGTVIIDDVKYPMTKHGFARRAMFTPVATGENFVTLRLTESAETLAQYPFEFALDITYELTDSGFRCRFMVETDPTTRCPSAWAAIRPLLCRWKQARPSRIIRSSSRRMSRSRICCAPAVS